MPLDARPPAIFLMGPTASGKTALACALATRFPLALVSVDSALVYRGLDIGAAKPNAETLASHPHALIDIRDPAQPYSAADFRTDALAAMHAATRSGKVPLLVGGTGLYFRALQHGLADLPEADPAFRTQLTAEAAHVGWPALHARLARVDPLTAARIGERDAQRIQRGLEVFALTGQPLSALQRGGQGKALPWRVLKLALVPHDRDALRARIGQRFAAMLAAGFEDELRTLHTRRDLHAELPAIRAVGYRQGWAWLEGTCTREAFHERAVFATRQLAKRQLTWLRHELDARRIDPDAGGALEHAADAVAWFLGGHARKA